MINRSLIRIKTVQILYSYLLTRSEFQLASVPSDSSRDRQFAYSVYLDLLGLLLKLSSVPLPAAWGASLSPDPAIMKNRLGASIAAVPAVREALQPRAERLRAYDGCLGDLSAAITGSAVYGDYKRRRKRRLADDVSFWTTVFSTVLRKNKSLERVLRKDEMFSHVGLDMGMNMFVTTLSGFDDTRASYDKARADLDESLRQAYNLYHALLMLPLTLTDIMAARLEKAKQKYLPTEQDLNPSTRLIDNLFVKALRNCSELTDYVAEHPDADPASWRDFDSAASRMLDLIMQSELYARYMESPAGDFATDASFWREALRNIILPGDDLAELLEGKSVYWNDDLVIMGEFALKTIRRSYAGGRSDDADDSDDAVVEAPHPGVVKLLPMFMNEMDERFGAELFSLVVDHRDEYRAMIDACIDTQSWDTERLAFMDIVIMLTAIAEIIHYPSIPIPVTVNEYVELANDYSTPKSGAFVNGILSTIVNKLRDEGKIDK